MSNGGSIPYHLRPNKTIDRELFISLLNRMNGHFNYNNYKYIGLGGPFLDDFKLLYSRVCLNNMISIEMDESVHKRQLFNKPFQDIICEHTTIEDYINNNEIDTPIIIWLDYTNAKEIVHQLDFFSQLIVGLQLNSIIRITLDASPSTLGNPDPDTITQIITETNCKRNDAQKIWRLKKLEERLASYLPAQTNYEQMSNKNFGKVILSAIKLAGENSILQSSDRKLIWSLSTHYCDGHSMVTATAVIISISDDKTEKLITDWEFHSTPDKPKVIDIPTLSIFEKSFMEFNNDNDIEIKSFLPKSKFNEDPLDSFRQYHRFFPNFAKVDI